MATDKKKNYKLKLKKYPNGGKTPVKPINTNNTVTAQDSADLFYNTLELEKYYKNYTKDGEHDIEYTPSEFKEQLDYDFNSFKRKPSVGYVTNSNTRATGKLPDSSYRQIIDSNKLKQRESYSGILDTRAPMALYDNRITPTKSTNYTNEKFNDITGGDIMRIYSYDKAEIKPYHLRTPEEKEVLHEKYRKENGIQDKPVVQPVVYQKPKLKVKVKDTTSNTAVYTDKKEFDEANKAYGDSLSLYKGYIKKYNDIDRNTYPEKDWGTKFKKGSKDYNETLKFTTKYWKEKQHSDIAPTAIFETGETPYSGLRVYKKPIQKPIFQAPVETKKDSIVTKPNQSVTKPTQQPTKPLLFKAKYNMPDTSASPNMQGEYPLRTFYQGTNTQREADSIEDVKGLERIKLQEYMRNNPKKKKFGGRIKYPNGGMANPNDLDALNPLISTGLNAVAPGSGMAYNAVTAGSAALKGSSNPDMQFIGEMYDPLGGVKGFMDGRGTIAGDLIDATPIGQITRPLKARSRAKADEVSRLRNEAMERTKADQAFVNQMPITRVDTGSEYLFPDGGMMPEANAELEKQEVFQTPDGEVGSVDGPSHSNGGVDVSLPPGTKIWSDRLKSGNKTFAQKAKIITNKINKLEKLPNRKYDRTIDNTLNIFNGQLDGLFVEQESMKQAMGVDDSGNRFPNGGEFYNEGRAKELGYTPDETGHMPSVDYTNGMWLKSKEHPTAWKELMTYSLNPELQKELKHPVINPEGYFGNNQLQYLPKKKYGGYAKYPGGGTFDPFEDIITYQDQDINSPSEPVDNSNFRFYEYDRTGKNQYSVPPADDPDRVYDPIPGQVPNNFPQRNNAINILEDEPAKPLNMKRSNGLEMPKVSVNERDVLPYIGPANQFMSSFQKDPVNRIRNKMAGPAMADMLAAEQMLPTRYDITPQLGEVKSADRSFRKAVGERTTGSNTAAILNASKANNLRLKANLYGEKFNKENSMDVARAEVRSNIGRFRASLGSEDANYQRQFDVDNLQNDAARRTMRNSSISNLASNKMQNTNDKMKISLLKQIFPNADLSEALKSLELFNTGV